MFIVRTGPISEPGFHAHCLNCLRTQKCNASPKNGFSCEIISCPLNCGMMFHACKKEEHQLLCSEEKVPCYNNHNGCPFKMKRRLLSAHLEKCPASVIYCTMEWHRSLKIMQQLAPRFIHLHCESCISEYCDLEVMSGYSCIFISCPLNCGMRMHACKYPEHQLHCPNEKIPCPNVSNGCPYVAHRKYIKNHYQSCFQKCLSQGKSCDKTSEHIFFSHFKNSSQKPPLDVALAIQDLSTLKWQIESQLPREICPDYGHCAKRIIKHVPKTVTRNHLPPETQKKQTVLTRLINSLTMISLQSDMESSSNKEVIFDHIKELLDENKRLKIENEMLKAKCGKNDINQNENIIEDSAISALTNKFNSIFNNWEKLMPTKMDQNDVDCDTGNFTSDVFNCLLTYPTRFLGLRPDNVSTMVSQEFTFLCSQEFRRDQYHMHYKNVHNDIQGGFNGCLQERCPLATYGCTFVQHILKPDLQGSKIVYSEMLGSFGVESTNVKELRSSQNDQYSQINLCDMPYIVLKHIIQFLDSFSLLNLSYTCELLHNVCQTLMTERGMVTVNWEQKEVNGTLKWVENGVKWNFSTHFSPIYNWQFNATTTMAEHLKSCKFNTKVIRTTPYRHGDLIEDESQWVRFNVAKGHLVKRENN